MWLRQLASLTDQDLKLATRNYLFVFAVILALLYILAVRFLIPAELNLDPEVYVLNQTGVVMPNGAIDLEHPKIHLVSSRDEMQDRLNTRGYSMGVVFTGDRRVENIEIIYQGYEAPKIREILVAATREKLREAYDLGDNRYTVEVLNPAVTGERPPFNRFLVPTFVYSEAFTLGLFLVAVMLFAEKGEGSIRAYQVTGRPQWMYLLSKSLAIAILGMFLTVLIIAFTVGWQVNWLALLLAVLLGSIFASLLGLLTANFFNGISEFIFGGVGIVMLVTLPTISYIFPSFSPWWLTWLPTYGLMFAVGEAVFPASREAILAPTLLILLAVNTVLLVAGARLFRWQLNHQA
ncbi:MAG: ABC transporter permease [Desulforudis sp.]|nr:MAG: ABC transporter permease [Desulforudis sp.]